MAKKTLSEEYREKVMKSGDAAESKYGKAKQASSRSGLTWLDADASELLKVAAAVIEDGAALLLAKTSDGGALVIRVVDDAGSHAWYPASSEALAADLREIGKAAVNP